LSLAQELGDACYERPLSRGFFFIYLSNICEHEFRIYAILVSGPEQYPLPSFKSRPDVFTKFGIGALSTVF